MNKSHARTPLAAIALVVSGVFLLTGCANRTDTPEEIKRVSEAKRACESAEGQFKMTDYGDYYCDLSTRTEKD